MSKKTATEEIAEKVVDNAENAASEPKYTVQKLRENSIKLFNVSQSTFDGAMHGHKETEYTINEVKAILDTWLYGKRGKK